MEDALEVGTAHQQVVLLARLGHGEVELLLVGRGLLQRAITKVEDTDSACALAGLGQFESRLCSHGLSLGPEKDNDI